MTDDGEFDEAAFRSYIVGKVADASDEVKTHVEAALDNCLSAETMATFAVSDIFFSSFTAKITLIERSDSNVFLVFFYR